MSRFSPRLSSLPAPEKAGALSFSSATMRAATFGPTPGARATIALSCNATALARSPADRVPITASATRAPTPCTICRSRNQSCSARVAKP